MKFESEFKHFHSRKCTWKCPLCPGLNVLTLNMLTPKQSSHRFVEDIFKYLIVNDFFYSNFTEVCSRGSDWQWAKIGIFMAINYLLIYTSGFLYISSYGSANAQLPGCFRPWTFSLNIGLNMFLLDSFMSCLYSILGYSTGEFQALQLIVLAVFGAVD